MPDYRNYRKSISDELISSKDRVRNFIDDHHWGEDGRYKEIILAETIKEFLPKSVSVGTGFVIDMNDMISTQIDIIIYKNDFPLLFKKADFVVAPKESVLGIIEVKTKFKSNEIREVVKKAHENGRLIGNHIFNGIFSYENGFSFENPALNKNLVESLNYNVGYINNIAFGKSYFMKYWEISLVNNQKEYGFYNIPDLSFGYFISNLVESVYQQLGIELSNVMRQSLYPIDEGKEAHRLHRFDINID
ncbi:DUF6602 domain-containing protein [Amedibacillus sp. YH-ame10]